MHNKDKECGQIKSNRQQLFLIGIGVVVSLILSIISILLPFIMSDKQMSANEIYQACIENVVEIRASSEEVGESFGTAEIIFDDGTMVTNAHVVTYTRLGAVNTFKEYSFRFSYEDEYRAAELIKYDSDKDIAVLKISDTTGLALTPIKTADSEAVSAGDKVYGVGNAANYGIGIFEGIVSIPLLNIEADGVTRAVIQCDLTIAAGNSGGALLNDKGELIGLTTFRTRDNSGNVIYGIVYSIPINTVLEYVN